MGRGRGLIHHWRRPVESPTDTWWPTRAGDPAQERAVLRRLVEPLEHDLRRLLFSRFSVDLETRYGSWYWHTPESKGSVARAGKVHEMKSRARDRLVAWIGQTSLVGLADYKPLCQVDRGHTLHLRLGDHGPEWACPRGHDVHLPLGSLFGRRPEG